MQYRVVLVVLFFAFAPGLTPGAGSAAAAASDATACGQGPGQRFFWVERAFCDLPLVGPARAHGVVIWNHGIHGTTESWRDPAPPALRLLAARGWDVVAIKRNNLAETEAAHSLYRAVARTRDEIRAQRALGYRKIVLAGQSFGGQVSLDAAERQPDVFAVVAFAPGMRSKSADGTLDAAVTERQLSRIPGEARVALVLPGDDSLFGGLSRGPGAAAALATRGGVYMLLDESSDVRGHTGATSGRFALRYGLCLGEFLTTATPTPGRFACAPARQDWRLIRELALSGDAVPKLATPKELPAALSRLNGWWYGTVGETVVVFGLVEDGTKLRAAYRWIGSRTGGGVYDAEVLDGRVRVARQESSVLIGESDGRVSLTWTASDGRTRTVPLLRGE